MNVGHIVPDYGLSASHNINVIVLGIIIKKDNLSNKVGRLNKKMRFYLEDCLTVKNQWELFTEDDGVCFIKLVFLKELGKQGLR